MVIPKPPYVLQINRPFYFAIVDNYQSNVIFSGQVYNPQEDAYDIDDLDRRLKLLRCL